MADTILHPYRHRQNHRLPSLNGIFEDFPQTNLLANVLDTTPTNAAVIFAPPDQKIKGLPKPPAEYGALKSTKVFRFEVDLSMSGDSLSLDETVNHGQHLRIDIDSADSRSDTTTGTALDRTELVRGSSGDSILNLTDVFATTRLSYFVDNLAPTTPPFRVQISVFSVFALFTESSTAKWCFQLTNLSSYDLFDTVTWGSGGTEDASHTIFGAQIRVDNDDLDSSSIVITASESFDSDDW